MNSINKLGSTGESHEGSTDDDENEEIFEVERVIDMKYEHDDDGRKITKYRVRWKGFGPIDDTWEPLENFTDLCLPVVQEFRQKYKKMKAKVAQSSLAFDVNILSEEINQIINKTDPSLKQPEIYYLVRWKGYDQSGNTWEHGEELRHAQNMIDAFNRRSKQGLARKIKKCNKEAYTNEIEPLDHHRKIKSEIDDIKDEHKISKTCSSNKIIHEERKKEKIKKVKLEYVEKEAGKTDKNIEIRIGKISSQREKRNKNEKERPRKSEEIRIKARRQHNRESEFRRGKEKKIRLQIDKERSPSQGASSSRERRYSKAKKLLKHEVSLSEYIARENKSEERTHKSSILKDSHKKKRKDNPMKKEKLETEVKEAEVEEAEVEEAEVEEAEVEETEVEEATEIKTKEDTPDLVDDYLSNLPEYNPEKVIVEIERQSSVVHHYSKDLLLNAIREDDYQKVFSYLRNNQIDNQDLDYSQLFLEVARCGQRDMALLLATRVPNLSIEDEFGDTALCMAASKGDAAFAHYLLVMGVSIQEAQVRPKDLAEKAGHNHFNLFLNQYVKEKSTET